MSQQPELPWTGERLVPSYTGDTAIEHLHRYAFAAEYARDKDVLDIACGEGYGSNLLARVAASVVGVDISHEVVAHARNKYGRTIKFCVGSCTRVPLASDSFDTIVSFETLEHIDDHDGMLQEVKRVLRRDGVFIISTPDKLNYGHLVGDAGNPFHVRELSSEEFVNLLKRYFKNTYFYEQKICHASILTPVAGLPVTGFRQYLGDFRRLVHNDGLITPVYNIAVATNNDDDGLKSIVSLFQGWDMPTPETRLAAETALARKLTKELADAEAGRNASLRELDALRRRVAKWRYRVVDAVAHSFDRLWRLGRSATGPRRS